jgi:hypothetical protein
MNTKCEFDGCTNSAWRTLTYGEYKSVPNPAGGQITVEPTSVSYCKDCARRELLEDGLRNTRRRPISVDHGLPLRAKLSVWWHRVFGMMSGVGETST